MSAERTIVVSGAGSGIGRAVTERLVADGGQVTAVGRRPEPLQELADELGKAVRPVAADVGSEAGAAAVAADLAAAGLACAGVVAAAGGLTPDQPAASPLEQARRTWQASFESNVLTAVLLVEALWADLQRQAGRIVLVSSVAALRGSGGGPYGAMKGALHAWAYDLARELGLQVIAEGVETPAQFDLLQAWGCAEVQGYYFAKPMPADELEDALRAGVLAPRDSRRPAARPTERPRRCGGGVSATMASS